MTAPALEIADLSVAFPSATGYASAVDRVTLDLAPGETLGLVGESGCGKTTLAMATMRLLGPSTRVTGSVRLFGEDLLSLSPEDMRRRRVTELGMVFQDPLTSLDPVFGVGEQVAERLRAAGRMGRQAARRQAVELLDAVGIPDPERRYDDPPHRFSGGMRQRIVIAIALANEPRVVIADEPTTALDVTIQAEILALLRRQCAERGTALLLITHDLGVVAQLCERVGVLYAGQLVELAATRELFKRPAHPYTRSLLRAVPTVEHTVARLDVIPGEIPDLEQPPPGCRFAPRCTHSMPVCVEPPPAQALGEAHRATCWLHAERPTVEQAPSANEARGAA